MKMGHVTGLKKERRGATPAFDAMQAAHLARITQEWAAFAQAEAAALDQIVSRVGQDCTTAVMAFEAATKHQAA